MDRRTLLKLGAMTSLLSAALPPSTIADTASTPTGVTKRRVRPGDPDWPSPVEWNRLKEAVGGRLINVESPLTGCAGNPETPVCQKLLRNLRNPFFIGDQAWATQNSGWLDAWMSAPSAYAVAAESATDVVAAVNFARERNLRLVIKGGGHSFQGTSCAPDSLLIWTRRMNRIVLHDAFVPQDCAGQTAPEPAVEIGAGAIWLHVYEAVTGKASRFVRGGGCTTVGVAGLVQSGGFGTFFKKFGTAACSLLEAEIVTADGQVRVANACRDPDLFWAIKGGGGGTFGVVTKLVLKTYELPEAFGSAELTVKAASDEAFRRLIGQFLVFYRDRLLNPHWDGVLQVRHEKHAGGVNDLARARPSAGRRGMAYVSGMASLRVGQAGGRQGLAAVPRLDRRVAPGLPLGGAADDREHAGAQVVGRRVSQEIRRRFDGKRPAARGDPRGLLVDRRRPGHRRLLAWVSIDLASRIVA